MKTGRRVDIHFCVHCKGLTQLCWHILVGSCSYFDLVTHVDNTLMTDYAVLFATIIVGYDIDFTHCIVEEMHECTLRRSTSILFPCLVHQLCIEAGTKTMPNMDTMIEVHRTQDTALIKVDENLMVPR